MNKNKKRFKKPLELKKVNQKHNISPTIDDILESKFSSYEKNLLIENLSSITISNYQKIFKGFPVEYAINKSVFYNLSFYINQNVLIPRSETEQIVEIVKSIIKTNNNYVFIDIGTGCGSIIISLAKYLTKIRIPNSDKYIGTDISSEAIKVAKINHQNLLNEIKIEFYIGSLFHSTIRTIIKNKYPNHKLFIIANLPYLSTNKLKNINPQTYKFEPHSALFSNSDGIGHYKKLFSQIKRHGITPYAVIIEIDAEEPHKFLQLCELYFPKHDITLIKDHRDKDRFIRIE